MKQPRTWSCSSTVRHCQTLYAVAMLLDITHRSTVVPPTNIAKEWLPWSFFFLPILWKSLECGLMMSNVVRSLVVWSIANYYIATWWNSMVALANNLPNLRAKLASLTFIMWQHCMGPFVSISTTWEMLDLIWFDVIWPLWCGLKLLHVKLRWLDVFQAIPALVPGFVPGQGICGSNGLQNAATC